jgi:hypothetical protein
MGGFNAFPLARHMLGHVQGAQGLIGPRLAADLCLPRQTRPGSELSLLPSKPLISLVRPAYEEVLRSTYPFEPAAFIKLTTFS